MAAMFEDLGGIVQLVELLVQILDPPPSAGDVRRDVIEESCDVLPDRAAVTDHDRIL